MAFRPIGRRYALYPAGLVTLLPLPFACMHRLAQPAEFRCQQCETVVQERSAIARVARSALRVLVATCLAAAVLMAVALRFRVFR
jgi:hypothetical protein